MTATTLLLVAAGVLALCWAASAVARVPSGQWTVVTRRGVVRRGYSSGWAWRMPFVERFEHELAQVHDLPLSARATTGDGVPVLVLAEATVSVPRPEAGTTYADPWPAAERAAEETIARTVTGWSAADLTQTAAAARRPLRHAVRTAVGGLGVEIHDLELVEVDVRIDEARVDPADLNLVVLVAAGLLLAAVAAVRVSSGFGLPTLLVYLALGIAVGEAGLGLEFEDAQLTQVLGTVALAVILAEGGFTTDWRTVRPVAPLAGVLATVGVAVSVAVTSGLVYVVLDVDVRTAILLGAVASSTDAAAVFAVLRRMPVRGRLRATVEAESGFNDPPVIILVTVVTSSAWSEANGAEIAGLVGFQLVVGVLVGYAVARAGQWLLVRSALPASGLYPIATLAIAFLAFAVAGVVGASALMAIYVAGLTLGNAHLPHRAATEGFAEGLAWLAQIGLFVMLGLLVSPSRLVDALPYALVVGASLTLIARPVSVVLCATPFRVPWREQAFISWAGLRGAVPIVLATIPMSEGLPAAHRIFDVVFLLVVVFTLVQGPTLPWVARALGAAQGDNPRAVPIESAPLEELDATLLQFSIPPASKLAGVEVAELRLPDDAAVALVLRDDRIFAPGPTTALRAGDHVLVAAARDDQPEIERRLRQVSEAGRLAGWYSALSRKVPA